MALRMTLNEVLTRLGAEGRVDDDVAQRSRQVMATYQKANVATPWFIRAMMGAGAWLAALFMISFFVCVGLAKNDEALCGVGFLLVVSTILLRRTGSGPFLEQLALALCLTGAISMEAGCAELLGIESAKVHVTVAMVQVAICGGLLWLYPDMIMRFMATLGITSAAAVLAYEAFGSWGVALGMLACAGMMFAMFIFQPALARGLWAPWLRPVSLGLVCTVVGYLLFCWGFVHVEKQFGEMPWGPKEAVLVTVGMTAMVCAAGWCILKDQDMNPLSPAAWLFTGTLVLLAGMTLHTPGIITAVGILLLGFHRRDTATLGLAVVFLLCFGSAYYYDLELSLLAKSLALLGSGFVLLGARQLLLRRAPTLTTEVQ
ncbi:DUF4401 domain-containing protein [Corallococcus sp. M34]|uniref:DUF4401 domain-containing protein n=1 Tax=Citreicoccus inhibens TaxID=2849499 RepID=UPI001C2270AD|nr:DUF4401 domain-containing protein [Citreicoccus inhibens]MBU8899286.1 DUF4401 domain-containing protein [Citreicoccus inhibens]